LELAFRRTRETTIGVFKAGRKGLETPVQQKRETAFLVVREGRK